MSIDKGYSGQATQGEHYDRTRYVTATEIAANVRARVKAAQKLGVLPDSKQGFKYSIRSDSFAGGQAVRIGVTAPDDRAWRTVTHEDRGYQRPDGVWVTESGQERTYSTEIKEIGRFLKGLGTDYTREDCDSQIDYFNVSCYINVTFNGGYSIGY